MPFDVTAFRQEFPFFKNPRTKDLVYLDSAATTQKPRIVLERLRKFYEEECSNVHRGMHPLAERATEAYERARTTVQRFLNARYADEIVFTKSCTEAINIVAKCYGALHLKGGDTILLSLLEHHSAVVPWMQLRLLSPEWLGITDDGFLRMDDLDTHLRGGGVRLLAITGLSNVMGVAPDLSAIIEHAHSAGAKVLVDAAQLVGHGKIDVTALDCDFLAFSGHKLFGPFGIGVLYGKRELLREMPPWLGGGMMIRTVTTEGYTPDDPPARFEGGTPPIAEAVALATAIEWLQEWRLRFPSPDGGGRGRGGIEDHEQSLLMRADTSLRSIKGLTILGPKDPTQRLGCISFTLEGIHPHDLTEILGRKGICMRAGHHCCQPLHTRLGITASTRLSVAPYNTIEEIGRVAPAIEEVQKILAVSP